MKTHIDVNLTHQKSDEIRTVTLRKCWDVVFENLVVAHCADASLAHVIYGLLDNYVTEGVEFFVVSNGKSYKSDGFSFLNINQTPLGHDEDASYIPEYHIEMGEAEDHHIVSSVADWCQKSETQKVLLTGLPDGLYDDSY